MSKSKLMLATLFTAAAAASAPAAAQDRAPFVEARMIADKPVLSLDPAKAYIYVRADMAFQIHLMREPNAEDAARYAKLRADALAEAREKYVKKKASYERAKADYDRTVEAYQKAKMSKARLVKPEEPVEPTEENFEFTAFGLMAGAYVGPAYRLSKKDESVYLLEITPGTYRIYSTSFARCFCMGSVKFDVAAGVITDLGKFTHDHFKEVMSQRDKGDSSAPMALSPRYEQPQPGAAVDPRLSALKVVPVALKPAGKLPNYFGGTVDRFPAVDGVMRYDRDKIVDLTAGN